MVNTENDNKNIRLWGAIEGYNKSIIPRNIATVLLNDRVTEQIFLGDGAKQGCPLSPVLFALVIQLFANVIR